MMMVYVIPVLPGHHIHTAGPHQRSVRRSEKATGPEEVHQIRFQGFEDYPEHIAAVSVQIQSHLESKSQTKRGEQG